MIRTLTMNLRVYTARFGHDDFYSLELSESYLRLRYTGELALCRWTTGGPRWKSGINSLQHVLGHDYIDFPLQFKTELTLYWGRWRSKEYDDEKTKFEMERLFDWLNGCTKSDEDFQKLVAAGEVSEWEIADRKRDDGRIRHHSRRRIKLRPIELIHDTKEQEF